MRLHDHPDRQALMQQYGYQKEDLLPPEDVAAYQFVREKGRTEVKALERTEDGFAAPTFNEALIRLSEETFAFTRDD
mgnify:FL=1